MKVVLVPTWTCKTCKAPVRSLPSTYWHSDGCPYSCPSSSVPAQTHKSVTILNSVYAFVHLGTCSANSYLQFMSENWQKKSAVRCRSRSNGLLRWLWTMWLVIWTLALFCALTCDVRFYVCRILLCLCTTCFKFSNHTISISLFCLDKIHNYIVYVHFTNIWRFHFLANCHLLSSVIVKCPVAIVKHGFLGHMLGL